MKESLSALLPEKSTPGKCRLRLLAGLSVLIACLLSSPQTELYARVVVDETVSSLEPVVEPDWLSVLENKAAEAQRLGLIDAQRDKLRKRLLEHAARPVEVLLPKAKQKERKTEVLFSAQRAAILPAQVRELVAGFERGYIFINADDKEQVRWLVEVFKKNEKGARPQGTRLDLPQRLSANTRIVAVAGNVQKLSEALRSPVWADQAGVLSRRFKVAALPSIAHLKGRKKADGEIEVLLQLESFVLDVSANEAAP